MEEYNEKHTAMPDKEGKQSNNVLVPGAIVVAGIFIAGAVIYSGGMSPESSAENPDTFGNNLSPTAENIQPVDSEDHIRGNTNAPVTIIEFSDFECPFCAMFHPTLKQILEEFDGEVRWVYRHFPLTSIHSRAVGASLASECVSKLGGNEAFWTFSDGLFSNQRSLGNALYIQLATELGLPFDEFSRCLEDEEFASVVEADFQDAVNSGGGGTPYTIVVNKDGELFPFSGALPIESVRQIITQALAE